MVIICAASGCSVKKDNTAFKKSVLFHRFPLRKPDLLAKWVKAMKNPNFRPTVTTYLCSAHFTESDYEIKPSTNMKALKPNAVPTVFERKKRRRKEKIVVRLENDEIIEEEKKIEEEGVEQIPEENGTDRIPEENETEQITEENSTEQIPEENSAEQIPEENSTEQIPEENETEETLEEEFLEVEGSDKVEIDLSEIIGNQEKGAIQVLIVDKDGKITNSEYILEKDLYSDEISKTEIESLNFEQSNGLRYDMGMQSRETEVGKDSYTEFSPEMTKLHLKNEKNKETIKLLESSLISSRRKIRALEMKCGKMSKTITELKILLKLLILKRGQGVKTLKNLLEEYDKFDMEVKAEDIKIDTSDLF